MQIREAIGVGFVVIACVLIAGSVLSLLNGQLTLTEFLTPGWTDFALEYPQLFAFGLVVGTLLFGDNFIAFVESL